MLKKIYALILALLLSLALASCTPPAAEPGSNGPSRPVTETTIGPEQSDEAAPAPEDVTEAQPEAPPEEEAALPEDGSYTTAEDVALYLHLYGHLPDNFITKKEAESLGWSGGGLDDYAYGYCFGGNRFGNYEGLLPEADGRKYTECDIDTMHASKRGAKRIVFSNDGLIYYTDDHYESFTLRYGEE